MNDTNHSDLGLLGGALAWSTVLALIVSGVMALRGGDTVALPIGWLAAWGPAAAVVGVCAGSLRLVGTRSQAVTTLGAAAIVLLGPLAAFGELLKRVTHHRPLGAVTFAVLAALALVLAIVVSHRLVQTAGREGKWRGVARTALLTGVALGLLFSGALLLLGLLDDSATALRAGVLDAVCIALAIAVASGARPWRWAQRPALSIALWGSAIIISAAVLALVPASRTALTQALPAPLPLAGWLGG